jgi:hypothetical protein
MALMFFPDRGRALREMGRVAAPGGIVALVVPASLDAQPAYGPFVAMATREAGPEAASLLGAYFACGDLPELRRLMESAGLRVTATRTRSGRATFPSADAFVAAEVESTPLHARIAAEVYGRISQGAREMLRPFTAPTGRLEIPLAGHLIAAAP